MLEQDINIIVGLSGIDVLPECIGLQIRDIDSMPVVVDSMVNVVLVRHVPNAFSHLELHIEEPKSRFIVHVEYWVLEVNLGNEV